MMEKSDTEPDELVEFAFQNMRESAVPEGSSDELISATCELLSNVTYDGSRVQTSMQRVSHSSNVSVALCVAALVLCSAIGVWFVAGNFGSDNNEVVGISESPEEPSIPESSVTGSVLPGGTVLLPLSGEPVCVDRSTWPAELLQEIYKL